MRKFALGLFVGLLIVAVTVPASAWEMKLKGESEYRYRYWTRTGDQDIFGQMDPINVNLGINHLQVFPTPATSNRLSGAGFGVMAGTNRYGSEMSWNDYRMTIYPEIKINPAISIAAGINLTSLGIWSDGAPYVDATSPRAAAIGYVNSLYVPIQDRPVALHVPNTYVTVQYVKWGIHLPFADLSIGYKDSKFGIGLWKHGCNRASASFGVSAKWGPLKIGFSPYFGRQNSAWDLTGTISRIIGNTSPARHVQKRNYFVAGMGELEYVNGPFYFGLLSDSYREPGEPQAIQTVRGSSFLTVAAPGVHANARPNEDIVRYRIAMAMKYFNGRTFINAEADWYNRWRSGRGVANPSAGIPTLTTGTTATTAMNERNDRNNDGWVYALELGTIAGPGKVTLNYVRATGDDPTTRITSEDSSASEQSVSACYMKEWGYLMYFMYGTGDGWDASGWGQPTNLHHIGIKIDYAVAANLNFRFIYSWAWRDQPNAYRFGGDYVIQASPWTNEDLRLSQLGVFRGRPVPDSAREIGWEVDLGFDWKLLEGMTWSVTGAYWKPGNWWAYAYPNTAHLYRLGAGTIPTVAVPAVTVAAPATSPAFEAAATFAAGREIDALFAVETSIRLGF